MARAETIESVGETGGGGNGPLPRHGTCRMELPGPLHWPGLLNTTIITSGSGMGSNTMHLYHNHHVHPLQAVCLSYTLPYTHPEGQDEPQSHLQLPAASPSPAPRWLLCNRRGERGEDFSGEQSDSDRDEHGGAHSQGPLPDLLPQNEHPPWASAQHRAPGEEAGQEVDVRRVANQLRTIGDEFNATVLHRAHAAPVWQDWRDACRGLFNFISQTLSTLYRHT